MSGSTLGLFIAYIVSKRKEMELNYNGYPIFKGLQKPLEFMGIRGRFLYYVGGAIALAFFGYLLCAFLIGQLVGLILLAIIAIGGYLYSFFLQKKGLHSKKKEKSILIVKSLFDK